MIRQAVDHNTVVKSDAVPDQQAGSGSVPGRRRAATFQRKYAQAVSAIEGGEILPEVKPVAALVACSTRTASSILARAVESDDRFSRDTRGRVVVAEVA